MVTSKWTAENMPDQSAKVAVVTGELTNVQYRQLVK